MAGNLPIRVLGLALFGVLALTGCRTVGPGGGPVSDGPLPQQAVLRVSVTNQSYNLALPWLKQRPETKIGLGAVIAGPRVLVTANLVEDAAYVELENLENGDQAPALVECVDYMANLAVLRCQREGFLEAMTPLELAPSAELGQEVSAWQFEENGTPFLTDGVIRSIETATYPFDGRGLLVYRVEISLSQLASSYVIPMIRQGKLAGVLMSYNSSTRVMTLVPSPVIEHFLNDLGDGRYDGFPQGGMSFAYLDDPQFRRYLGVEALSGVYVTQVRPGGTAAQAGLKKGDVILAINEFALDRNGEYHDPEFGRVSLSHLVSTRSYAGDILTFRLLRDGEPLTIEVPVDVVRAQDYPIPPYVRDTPPSYVVEGGLVFLELSREYLRAWGPKWQVEAPRRLQYYDEHQWELLQPGERVVILSHVLPSRGNVGFNEYANMVVKSINGQAIRSLKALTEAMAKPVDGFTVVEFEEQNRAIFLRADRLAQDNRQIQQLYQLPALSRLQP